MKHKVFRKTTQHLAPAKRTELRAGTYDIYPAFPVASHSIGLGYDALASRIAAVGAPAIMLDGFCGVFWPNVIHHLDASLNKLGISPVFLSIEQALRPAEQIDDILHPYLGGNDPLFGKRYPGKIREFFDPGRLEAMRPDATAGLTVLYGTGAALAGWDSPLFYFDVPKNEVQFRSRAGHAVNIGTSGTNDPKAAYKRMYFVDWPVLNRHRADLLPRIDIMLDEQRPDEPTFMPGNEFRRGLDTMARNYIRVRPWFEPGPWGGQWIKQRIPQLSEDARNYAWSFELISPENGIAFESDGIMLEASFDFLMLHNHREVLGDFAGRFGYEFPIRYDFLDTFDGGNLSLQCHPRPEYVHANFGETFTQDEAYYILDCEPGARVYLGFKEGIQPELFRAELERSQREGVPVDVERHVNTEPAHKHDLFLIPNGTIHCSGANNLVLEISATPYIFTFKMYDWMRMDLDGKPRPLNIDRAFANLYFDRQGKRVRKELIAHPVLLRKGRDWHQYHLQTHPIHFYDVHRWEFATTVDITMDGSCHVLSLTEGESVILETQQGHRALFNYAETFVIPAAAGSYKMTNNGKTKAKVVTTFLKPWARPFAAPEGADEIQSK
jgi:mannose-6-phosphate isomerase class I